MQIAMNLFVVDLLMGNPGYSFPALVMVLNNSVSITQSTITRAGNDCDGEILPSPTHWVFHEERLQQYLSPL